MERDMTSGSILKVILSFSLPILIGNLFQQLYNLVDTIIVGRFLGIEALAAVGSTGTLMFLIGGLVIGISSGFSVMIAQKFGANDEGQVRLAIGNASILGIILTVIISTISLLSMSPLLQLLNTPENILGNATTYIQIICAGLFANMFYNVMAGILRAIGDSKTPLYFLIVSTVLNIILDIIFIVVFQLGVAGVAYATVLAQFVSAILCLFYMLKKYPLLRLNGEHFKLNKEISTQHLRLAIPMGLQFPVTAIGGLIVQSVLNKMGANTIAAFTAAVKVEQLAVLPGATLGATMATFCGQNIGAKQFDRIKAGVKIGMLLTFGITIVLIGLIFLFAEPFIGLFIEVENTEVLSIAKQYLTIVSPFYIVLCLMIVISNALQGMGDSIVPILSSGTELISRTVVALTLPTILGFTGICLAGPVAWVLSFVILGIIYFRKMKNFNILTPE